MTASRHPVRVLLVCAGNICRSPMAEALFRRHASRHPELSDIEVASAGVIALTGSPATPDAIAVMHEEYDLDISTHRARLLDGDTAALVLTVDRWVTERAERLDLAGQVVLLGEYAGSPGEEVGDPYLGPRADYSAAASHLDRLVRAAVDRLVRERRGRGGSSPRTPPGPTGGPPRRASDTH